MVSVLAANQNKCFFADIGNVPVEESIIPDWIPTGTKACYTFFQNPLTVSSLMKICRT